MNFYQIPAISKKELEHKKIPAENNRDLCKKYVRSIMQKLIPCLILLLRNNKKLHAFFVLQA